MSLLEKVLADRWCCGTCGATYSLGDAAKLGWMCEQGLCRDQQSPLFDHNGNQHSRFTGEDAERLLPSQY